MQSIIIPDKNNVKLCPKKLLEGIPSICNSKFLTNNWNRKPETCKFFPPYSTSLLRDPASPIYRTIPWNTTWNFLLPYPNFKKILQSSNNSQKTQHSLRTCSSTPNCNKFELARNKLVQSYLPEYRHSSLQKLIFR